MNMGVFMKKQKMRSLFTLLLVLTALLLGQNIYAAQQSVIGNTLVRHCLTAFEIDGDIDDWMSDGYFTAQMYEDGDPTKPVLGALFACTTGSQMYVWVTGGSLVHSPDDAWATINGGPKVFTGNSPADVLAYVGTEGSYEAVMTLALVCSVPATIQVHALASGNREVALGGGSPTVGVPMVEDCDNQLATPTPVPTAPPTAISVYLPRITK